MVELRVEGMTCAACVGRVERKLGKLDGVRAVVNLATERASVEYPAGRERRPADRPSRRPGYGAPGRRRNRPATDTRARPRGTTRALRSLRRRMAVALVLFVPLADLSLAMSLVPSLRFPYWQAVVAVLALPGRGLGGLAVPRAAARNLRHGTTSMDTLVSLGVIAASGWSLGALAFTDGAPAVGGWQAVLHPAGPLYLEVAAGVTTFVLAGRYFEARAAAHGRRR